MCGMRFFSKNACFLQKPPYICSVFTVTIDGTTFYHNLFCFRHFYDKNAPFAEWVTSVQLTLAKDTFCRCRGAHC